MNDFGWSRTETVRFSDCDCNGAVRISALMRMLAELATEDYAARGFSRTFLLENGMAFLLAGESLRFHRRPQSGETLRLQTWERQVKGPRYLRDFAVWNEAGELLVSAATTWILVNPETRQIYRRAPIDFAAELHPETAADTLPVERPEPLGEVVPVGERIVRFSDLDGNGHLNHAVYADIALDALRPEEAGGSITDFRISYHAEATLGEPVTLYRGETDGGILLVGEKSDKTRCFSCEIRDRQTGTIGL